MQNMNVCIYDVVFSLSDVTPEFVSEIIGIIKRDTSHKLDKKCRDAYHREIV